MHGVLGYFAPRENTLGTWLYMLMLYNTGYLPEEFPQTDIVGFELHPDETINLPSMYPEDNDQHKDEMTVNHSTIKSNIATENTSIPFGNYWYIYIYRTHLIE